MSKLTEEELIREREKWRRIKRRQRGPKEDRPQTIRIRVDRPRTWQAYLTGRNGGEFISIVADTQAYIDLRCREYDCEQKRAAWEAVGNGGIGEEPWLTTRVDSPAAIRPMTDDQDALAELLEEFEDEIDRQAADEPLKPAISLRKPTLDEQERK